MLGLANKLTKVTGRGRTFTKDGLKLYMPYRGGSSDEVQFVGTGSTSFDGANDYVAVSDAANLSFGDSSTDSAFSISAWINMTDATSFPILGKGVYNTDAEFDFRVDSDDKLHLYLYDESVADTYELAKTAVLTTYEGAWTHVVATYNGVGGTSANGGILLYVNGVSQSLTLSDNGTYVAMEGLAHDVWIGRYSSYYAEGSIKNVAIWNRALTATEVQNVMYKTYEEVGGRLASGLVSWWALDVDYTDSKGSNDGTNSGSTLNTDIYGGDTPVKPRAIDNAPTVQADSIGAGSAFFVTGNNDYIDLGNVASLDLGDGGAAFTLAAWTKGAVNAVFSKYETTVGGYSMSFVSNKPILFTKSDDDYLYGTSSGISTDEWHHIVFTKDGATIICYVDGIEQLSATNKLVDIDTTSNNAYIGNGKYGTYDGNICQVGVWTAALTQAQIQSVMEKTYDELTASERTNLVSYWPLDNSQNALSFVTNDKISIVNADNTLGAATYSFWLKSSDTGANGAVFGHGGTNGRFMINAGGSSNQPLFQLGSANYNYFADNAAQDDGKWHHWLVYTGGASIDADINDSKCYVDDVALSDSAYDAGLPGAYVTGLTLGEDGGAANFCDMSLAQFAVWTGDKTSNVSAIYAEGINADWTNNYQADMTGYWKMNNATIVTDLSGNDNNGTVDGATLADGYVLDSTSNNNHGLIV